MTAETTITAIIPAKLDSNRARSMEFFLGAQGPRTEDDVDAIVECVMGVLAFGSRYSYRTVDGRNFEVLVLDTCGSNSSPCVVWDFGAAKFRAFEDGYAFRRTTEVAAV